MTLDQQVDLPDGTSVTARARWQYGRDPGTDARGWELIEYWVPGHPHLSLTDREHVRRQLTPPTDRP